MIYHIDTDMGVDDGLALVLAQRLFGDRLASLSTVFGNVPVGVATRNARLFRRLLGRTDTLPIWEGAAAASDGYFRDARHVHGGDGLGGATLGLPPALAAALDAEASSPVLASLGTSATAALPSGPVCLIALGPATNLPNLVALFGPERIERIVFMGGAVFDRGNIADEAEFNAHCDPGALAWTLASGLPVTLVPLDICRKVQLPRVELEAALAGRAGPLTRLLLASHLRYMAFYRGWEELDGCFPHDSVAVYVAARPDRVVHLEATLAVEREGEARGRIRLLATGGRSRVALGGSLRWTREAIADTLAAAARC